MSHTLIDPFDTSINEITTIVQRMTSDPEVAARVAALTMQLRAARDRELADGVDLGFGRGFRAGYDAGASENRGAGYQQGYQKGVEDMLESCGRVLADQIYQASPDTNTGNQAANGSSASTPEPTTEPDESVH